MKSPAFQFYVREWILSRSVQKMSGEEIKAYMYLLCESWLETPRATLPNDDIELSIMAKLPLEAWNRLKPKVMSNFKIMDNRWVNEKLFGVSEQQQRFSKWGKNGGNPNFTKGKPNPYYQDNPNQKDNPKDKPIDNPTHKAKDNLSTSTSTSTDTSTKKESTVRSLNYSEDFLQIWESYPNKVGKSEAFKAWKRLNPDETLKQMIMRSIEIQKRWPQWVKDSGKFIPHFSTWINQMRWEDEGIGKITGSVHKLRPSLEDMQNG